MPLGRCKGVRWLAAAGILMAGLAGARAASAAGIPRVNYRRAPATAGIVEAEKQFDRDFARVAPGLSVPLAQNLDRVHLTFMLLKDRRRITLAVPASWSDQRAADVVGALSSLPGWQPGRVTVDRRGSWLAAYVIGTDSAVVHGRWTDARLDLPETLSVLRRAGAVRVEIRIWTFGGPSLQVGASGLEWYKCRLPGGRGLVALAGAAAAARPMRLRFGLFPWDLRRAALTMMALVLWPLLALTALRTWALSRRGMPGGYRVYRTWTRAVCAMGCVVPLVYVVAHREVLDAILTPVAKAAAPVRFACVLATVIGPQFLILMVSTLLSYRVDCRMRGLEYRPGEYFSRTAGPWLALATPLLAAAAGATLLPRPLRWVFAGDHGPGIGMQAALWIGIISAGVLYSKRLGKRTGVSAGDLAEGVLDLCRRAGVSVKQVTLLQGGPERTASVTLANGVLTLSDLLVTRLTREELDAAVAHQLAGLRLKHESKVACAMIGFGVGVILVAVGAVNWLGGRPLPVAAAILGYLVLAPALAAPWQRKLVLEADAEAVRLTGDAPAYVRMLELVAGLNREPSRQSGGLEWIRGAPSIQRRVKNVLAVAGSPVRGPGEVRWQPFGDTSAALDDLPPDVGTDANLTPLAAEPAVKQASATPTLAASSGLPGSYALPHHEMESRVFTQAERLRHGRHYLQAALSVLWLVPAAPALLLFDHRTWRSEPWMLGAAFAVALTGWPLTLLASALLEFGKMRWFRTVVQARAERVYRQKFDADVHVGVSPGSETRIYEAETSWDAGFLRLEPGRLAFYGDRGLFSLRPGQIVGVEVKARPKGLAGAYPRVFVTWEESREGARHVFNLEPRDARSLRDLRQSAEELRRQIDEWRHSPDMPGSITLGDPPLSEQVFSSPVPLLDAAGRGSVLVALAAGWVALFALSFLIGRLGGSSALRFAGQYRFLFFVAMIGGMLVQALAGWIEQRGPLRRLAPNPTP